MATVAQQLNTLRTGQAMVANHCPVLKVFNEEEVQLNGCAFSVYWREKVGEPKSHPLEAIKS